MCSSQWVWAASSVIDVGSDGGVPRRRDARGGAIGEWWHYVGHATRPVGHERGRDTHRQGNPMSGTGVTALESDTPPNPSIDARIADSAIRAMHQ